MESRRQQTHPTSSSEGRQLRFLKTALFAVAAAIVIHWTIDYTQWLGLFLVPKYNHAPGPCVRLHGIEHGSEDIQVLPNGLAFISSGLILGDTDEYKKRVGRIYLFDYNHPNVPPHELPIIADANYRLISPRGISIWTDNTTGAVYLYVISHLPYENIDKFRFDEKAKTLTHLRRFANYTAFHKLNDVVVVGEDKFYYTNFFYNYMFELTFRWFRWGSIGFFDGETATLIDTGLFIPNGAILSKDGRFLYVAALGDEEIRIYGRNPQDNSLTFVNSFKVWSKVDNVDIDAETGDLWIGTHPHMLVILKHLGDPAVRSPSQILKVKLSKDQRPLSIVEVYSNDGSFLSASSIGVRHGNGLLIGSVVTHAAYCDIKYIDNDKH